MQQKNMTITILLILVLIFAATTAYLATNKPIPNPAPVSVPMPIAEQPIQPATNQSTAQIIQQPTPAATNDNTAIAVPAGWQTYKNDKYGYSVNYPSNWVMENDPDPSNNKIWIDSSAGYDAKTRISISSYGSMADFDNDLDGSKNAQTADQLITNEGWQKVGTKNISGILSTEFMEGALGGNNFDVIIPKNGNLILFQFIGADSLASTENQILSSFKFAN